MSERDPGSTTSASSMSGRLLRWVFLDGSRLAITGVLIVGIFLLTWGLVAADVLTVGPRSSVKTMFGSGVVAGQFTVITIALGINQLISSRVFGSPNDLGEKFEGGQDVRENVERIADRRSSPVETAAFVSFIGTALRERVVAFGRHAATRPGLPDEELEAYSSRLDEYAAEIEHVSDEMHPVTAIEITAGSEYAQHIRDTDEVSHGRSDELPDRAREDLTAIGELLRSLSISRQYFKTIALQQDFAQLSRLLIYAALPAVLTSLYVPLLYQSGPSTTIPVRYLPVVLSGAVAVALLPLVILLVHLLRLTTIMRYTVSVGPFVPPVEWPWSE